MFWFHGPMPYGPVTLASTHAESSKAGVFQPAGGLAVMPGRVFQVPSVTMRVPSSSAAAMRLPAPPPLKGAIAITFVPGTSSDLMSLICEVCHALLPPPEFETCVPLTNVVWPSSAFTRRTADVTAAGSATSKVLRRTIGPAGVIVLAPATFQIQLAPVSDGGGVPPTTFGAATVVGAVPMLVMTRDSRRSPPSPVSMLTVPPRW